MKHSTYKYGLTVKRSNAHSQTILQIRPYGQAVKTTPSHGVNSGSSPDKVTILAVFDRKIYQKPLFLLFFRSKSFVFGEVLRKNFYQLFNFSPSFNKYSSDKFIYKFPKRLEFEGNFW